MLIFGRAIPNGASNAMGYEQNRDFRPITRFISNTIKDTVIVTMESVQETVPKLSSGAIANDLE